MLSHLQEQIDLPSKMPPCPLWADPLGIVSLPMPTKLERHLKPTVYSWSTKVDFVLNRRGGFRDLADPCVCLLWSKDYVLTLDRRKIHPDFESSGSAGYRLTIEATDTACDAETLGSKLALGLLSIAAERIWGLSLAWPDSPLPCRVIDRTASIGATMEGFGRVTSHIALAEFIDKLEDVFDRYNNVPYRLLLSMELCTSSRIETNNRSRLILLVSALEALAEQRDFRADLGTTVADLKATLNGAPIQDATLKASLLGQIDNLIRESASRAVRRLLQEHDISRSDVEFVEEAYAARSKIVHEGQRVPELDAMAGRLDQILLQLYQAY